MARRILFLLALLLVVAACSGSGSDGSTTTGGDGATTTTVEGQTTTTGDDSPTTTSGGGSSSTTAADLSGLEGVSEEARTQLVELIRQAQEIRGLPFLEPPTITVVSEEELEARVRADLEEEAEDFPADEALYKMLGLLAEDADFESIVLDLYGEQVAGFYDGDTGEIVVPAREDGFSLIQQGTMVHELVHALTDQHFDFNPEFQAMVDEERLDQATAYQALIEGDATLAEVLWVQTLSQRELGEFIAESLDIDSASFESAPRFLRESLIFPYDTGLAFVQDLYVDGQWEAVNDAYATMPGIPGSSEQVITPDDYTRDIPVEVAIPTIEVPGYELERTSVWGEEGFRILLNQGTGISTVGVAADGWGGDAYHQWFDGQNAAILIVYQGDTPQDVDELETALLDFATENFPEDHFAWVEQLNGDLYFIAADDTAVGEQIRASAGLD
ncbi:MAG TPA: hypothetical protein VFS66_09470 [Acidimicrobiia bacterium]|nr:hypothetical protein [Acidimicrobiia bacterium]